MTTFGGRTVPPIFGGGAPPLDAIFIRALGNTYIHENYPVIDGIIPLDIPAGRVPGDLLVAIMASFTSTGSEDPSTGNYTNILNGSGGYWRIFSRIATGDANDNFSMTATITASAAIRWGKVIALASADPAKSVTHLSVSATRTEAGGGDFVRAELQLPGDSPNFNIAFLRGARNLVTGASMVPPDLEFFSTGYDYNTGIDRATWMYWGYAYQETAAVIPEANVVHTPDTNLAFTSSWLTFHLV